MARQEQIEAAAERTKDALVYLGRAEEEAMYAERGMETDAAREQASLDEAAALLKAALERVNALRAESNVARLQARARLPRTLTAIDGKD